MSDTQVPVIVCWEGHIRESEKGPKYCNGHKTVLGVHKSITLSELKDKISTTIFFNLAENEMDIKCRWPLDQRTYTVVDIKSNEATSLMMNLPCTPVLYMGKRGLRGIPTIDNVHHVLNREHHAGYAVGQNELDHIANTQPSQPSQTVFSLATPTTYGGGPSICIESGSSNIQRGYNQANENNDGLNETQSWGQGKDLHESRGSSDNSSDDDGLPTDMQDGVIAEEAIRTTILDMDQRVNVVSYECTQFKSVPGIEPIEEWYDATSIDEGNAQAIVEEESELNFDNWVGREFTTKTQLITLLNRWSIKKAVEFSRVKSNKSRLNVRCVHEDCAWRLHASVSSKNSLWIVKACPRNHSCVNEEFVLIVGNVLQS